MGSTEADSRIATNAERLPPDVGNGPFISYWAAVPCREAAHFESRTERAAPQSANTHKKKLMTNDVWKRRKSNQLGSVDFIILLKSGCSIIKFQIEDFFLCLRQIIKYLLFSERAV